jgi:hypothetical protein
MSSGIAAWDESKVQLKGCLHQARIANPFHAPKIRSIRNVTVWIEKAGVVCEIKNVPTKLQSGFLIQWRALLYRKVPIV